MMLWPILAAMTAAAAAIVLVPLLRRQGQRAPRAAHDLAVYRDQLGEIERDVARGLLAPPEAASARLEIARRVLAAAASPQEAPTEAPPDAPLDAPLARRRIAAACALAAMVSTGAMALYLTVGSPELAVPPEAPRGAQPGGDMASLVDQLTERLKDRPDDGEGWRLLARGLAGLERYGEAAEAYGRAAALAPDDAGLASSQGEALIFAAGGSVTPAAHAALLRARARDPAEPRARYYLGLAEAQAGRRREALDAWLALERDSPADAPWRGHLTAGIERLAGELGVSLADRARGPGRAEIEAAGRMSAEDRMTMIRSMVASLASRLEHSPNDLDGWLRLGRAHQVLGSRDQAATAYRRAAALAAEGSPERAEIERLIGALAQPAN